MRKHQLMPNPQQLFSLPFFLLWFVFSTAAFTGIAKLGSENNLELSITYGFGITMLVLAFHRFSAPKLSD